MLKETYSALTKVLEDALSESSAPDLNEEIKHVKDSLLFSERTSNDLEGAVSVCNALEMLKHSPHCRHCGHIRDALGNIGMELDNYIRPHVRGGSLQLEDCHCVECLEITGLYSFGQEHDKHINNKAVYELMYLSHICDGCWQDMFGSSEEA